MFVNPPEAMLARQSMHQEKMRYWSWIIEEKMDGIRALIVKRGNTINVYGRNQTQKGRQEFTNQLPEIQSYFAGCGQDFIIDCELMSKSFLAVQSKVMTTTQVIDDPSFHVVAFDILQLNDEDFVAEGTALRDRKKILNDFVNKYGDEKFLRLIPTTKEPFLNEDHLAFCYNHVVNRGGEGLVLKNPSSPYIPGKRSNDWVKVIEAKDCHVLFVGKVEGTGKYKNSCGSLQAILLTDRSAWKAGDTNKVFNVGTGLTDEQRNRLWKVPKRLFPLKGEIKCKEVYPDGKPRMPVFVSIDKVLD